MRYLRKKEKPQEPRACYAAPFFAVLALLTVVSFIIPLRPTRSNIEKRNLALFPEFSVEALLSGDFFDDITLWFSDTFPGRETWLSVATNMEALYGYSEISIDGALPDTDEVPPVTEAQLQQTQPPQDSQEEAPLVTEETQPETTEPEKWGGIDAGDAAEILQTTTAIQIGDSVFGAQGFSQMISDKYIEAVNSFADIVKDKDITVVNSIPPTAVGILIEEEYLEKLNCVSQLKILDYLHAGMADQIVTVDTVTPLIEHNNEYIYFHTDHHWTALGAYYFYEATMQALELDYVKLEDLELWPQGEFIGSMYIKAKRPHALKIDTCDAYIPIGDIVNTVYNQDGWGRDWPLLTDCTERETNAKYMVFGTDFPMTHAENRSIPDAPNVLLIKDSFGNAVVPFMTQTFHNVYAIDYRKYYLAPVKDLIEQYDIDYVIFMPNLTATQATQGPGMIRRVSCGY